MSVADLAAAVHRLHGGSPRLVSTETVTDTFQGREVWSRKVSTFDLGPEAPGSVAYAWAEPVPDSGRLRYFAVLQAGPVRTALDAVRASIAHDARRP